MTSAHFIRASYDTTKSTCIYTYKQTEFYIEHKNPTDLLKGTADLVVLRAKETGEVKLLFCNDQIFLKNLNSNMTICSVSVVRTRFLI